MTTKIKYSAIAVVIVLLLVMFSSGSDNQSVEFQEDGTITIGVAWPTGRGLFVEGAKLAVKEVNEAGGLLGQQVELIVDEREEALYKALDETSLLTAGESIKEYSRIVARDFSHHKKQVVAVTGHQFSVTAFSAAQIYQQNETVFIAPTATNVLLTNMNFDYVYRMLPTNVDLGKQLADFASNKNYQRVAIFNERSESALELSEAFSQSAEEYYGIDTAIQRSFFSDMPKREFTDYAVNFSRTHKKAPLDAIFLFTDTTLAIQIIREFQKRGLGDIPYIGGENLDNQVFWQALEQVQTQTNSTINVAIPSVFNSNSTINQPFVNSFTHQYQQAPDRLAALGYDSIQVILRAIASAGSSEPSKIADEMRYSPICRGLTGHIVFEDNGDATNKNYIIKTKDKQNYRYQTLAGSGVTTPRAANVQACVKLDRDDDGVVNMVDKCPDNTKEQLTKGIYLDGERRGCPIASDDDDVPDYRDDCPNDTAETLAKGVNGRGCPKDSDHDLIADFIDHQPNNSPEAISAGVDTHGIPLDSDGDKVPDYRDDCPKNTKAAQSKGIDKRGCPNDSDQDKVADYLDKCPNESAMQISKGVDNIGCALDTDGDKVADYRDACQFTSKAAVAAGVDAQGCPIDNDGDGVPNYGDNCPNDKKTALSFGVDAKGCPQDSDKDAVADHADKCPDDDAKTLTKGIDSQGCPVDSDKDGVINVYDACPKTPPTALTFAVDDKGCAVDSDKDGLLDYLDACPQSDPDVAIDGQGCALPIPPTAPTDSQQESP